MGDIVSQAPYARVNPHVAKLEDRQKELREEEHTTVITISKPALSPSDHIAELRAALKPDTPRWVIRSLNKVEKVLRETGQ